MQKSSRKRRVREAIINGIIARALLAGLPNGERKVIRLGAFSQYWSAGNFKSTLDSPE